MKVDKRVIFLVFLLLLPFSVAYYNSYECECHNHPTLSVTGSNEALGEENCGRACGGLTACPLEDYEDCTKCCEEYWCDKEESGLTSDDEVRGCMESCVKTCSSKSMLVEIYEAIKLVVVIAAALMFALCGIFYLLSDKPESRDKAKGCMVYSIIGLVVVGLAIPLVELIYELTLPAGIGPGISCISVIGDAVADCYDKAIEGVKVFRYPCSIVDVGSCEGSVTEEDVHDYLDSIGRRDITGSTSPALSKIVWHAGTITKSSGDICFKVWGDHGDADVEVAIASDDELCRSKEQIDLVGSKVMSCWNENEGSSVDVYCSSIDESDIKNWPGDVRVTDFNIYSYLHFYGNGDADVDFKNGDLTNSYGDDACITYDTWAGGEIFVSKARENDLCRLHVLESYIDLVARMVLSCWNGRPYPGDTECNEINVSGWPPSSEVSVTEEDVENYLEDVLNEPDVPVDFESGPISSDWGTDHVCIAYDDITAWPDDVDVVKASENPVCS